MRSGGEVGLDMAQRFELIFLALSTFHKVSKEVKRPPFSTSSHFGSARAPVYLAILAVTCCSGVSSDAQEKLYRISRSSRTLVPCSVIGFNSKSQAKIARNRPAIAWSQKSQEYVYPPRRQ